MLALAPRHGKARHALTIQRFDRQDGLRLHCQSAHTALRAARLPLAYSALATVLLRLAHPDHQAMMREELFRRMVFNILTDNTDDHERNHCLRLGLDGYHDLSPAYDVVPSLQNLGVQAMQVGTRGAESTLDNALSERREFGLSAERAHALVAEVARVVDGWPAHFEQHGVHAADMELLRASLDRDALRLQRKSFC